MYLSNENRAYLRGILAALQVIAAYGEETLFAEVVELVDFRALLSACEEDDLNLSGLRRYGYVDEKGDPSLPEVDQDILLAVHDGRWVEGRFHDSDFNFLLTNGYIQAEKRDGITDLKLTPKGMREIGRYS
jgi:hypothetical protein